MNGGWQEAGVRESWGVAAGRGAQRVRYIGFTHPVFIEAAEWMPAVNGSAAADLSLVCGRCSVHENGRDEEGYPCDKLALAA